MKTVPTMVVAMNARAAEVYGHNMIATALTYQMNQGGRMYWQGHVCILNGKSIFCEGATPAAAFDATMARINLDSAENLATVLGIVEAA